jgi:hypothetical protein
MMTEKYVIKNYFDFYTTLNMKQIGKCHIPVQTKLSHLF